MAVTIVRFMCGWSPQFIQMFCFNGTLTPFVALYGGVSLALLANKTTTLGSHTKVEDVHYGAGELLPFN